MDILALLSGVIVTGFYSRNIFNIHFCLRIYYGATNRSFIERRFV